MGPFRENAFYLLAWRAVLVALIALVLIATRFCVLATAFLTGANVALVFSLGLIAWSERLSEERIVRTEAWRCLKLCVEHHDRRGGPGSVHRLPSIVAHRSVGTHAMSVGADRLHAQGD